MWDRIGAIPAPPPMKSISASVSRAKNSPKGAEIVTLSPGFREKSHYCLARYLEDKYVGAGKMERSLT